MRRGSENNDGVIMTTMDTTTTLPWSIMLYAVDEYFRSRLYVYGTPVVGQLFVFYIPNGNNNTYYQQ